MRTKNFSQLLFILLALFNINCTSSNHQRFSEFKLQRVRNFAPDFKNYCVTDRNSNYELNAVESSFYGDYQNAIDQATKREAVLTEPSKGLHMGAGGMDKAQMLKALQAEIDNPGNTTETKAQAQAFLDLILTPPATELFAEAKPVLALNHIAEKAKSHHFTLINEAHYNSQHRAFTKDLLKPLWEKGYRYLALEALGYNDPSLHERGYPILSTGYYLKDTNFGNLVREALQIGYKLVAYETQNNHDGTLRDRDQATNIYEQTWKKDQKGKVLIHAGYSHISETGDSQYEPMGLQLKKMVNQEILTIDQVRMVGLIDSTKQHPYYREVTSKFKFSQPTILLSKKGEVIVDPIIKSGTDMQVYHPITRFEQGRPHWLKSKDIRQIPLASELTGFEGALIQAMHQSDIEEAVPVDQFIIAKGRPLVLPNGNYKLRIINCEGDLIATAQLKVN